MKKFSSSILLLLLSLLGVTAQAQITDVSQITNGKTYTIKSVNRGFIFYDAATSTEYLRSSSISSIVNNTPTGAANEQFAFLRGDNTPAGQFYLYNIGSGKFVSAETATKGLKLSDTPSSTGRVTLTASSSYFVIKYPNISNVVVNITSWDSKYGIRAVAGADPDDGNKMTIKEVADVDLSEAVAKINASETPDIYQIRAKDNARGVLYAGNAAGNGANENGEMSTAGSTYNMNGYNDFASVAINQNNAYQQFAFIEWKGKTYLYNIGTHSYVYNAGGYFAFSQTNQEAVELQAVTSSGNTAYKLLKFLTSNTFLTFSNGGGRHAVNPQTGKTSTATDDGDLIAVNAIGLNLTPAEWAKAVSLFVLPAAKSLVASAEGMGLPSAEGKAAISAMITSLEAALENGTATYAQVVALQEAVDNCPVAMPQSGKAYTIQFKHMNGAYTYFYWDEVNGKLALGVLSEGQALPETAKFICRQVGDKYAFVNNAGKYLTWRNNKTADGYNSGKGGTDAYDADQNLFTLAPIAASTNVVADADFLAGTLSITGKRANGNVGVFVIKAAGEFDGAGEPFVTNASPYYSSAAIFTETTYPNTVTFKATDLTDGENAVALATFSAPFATVLPEGVTAYSVTQDAENNTMLNVEALTGQALPANTGFILAGTEGANVTMVPATNETLVDATGTLLQHSAGAPKALNQNGGFDFILGSKNGHVAFYRVNDAANELPMNRAYLHLAENPFSLGTLHMIFGGNTTTAIQGVQNGQQLQAPIYDLSGRRVQQLQKGGIYIQGGKKFIVK